MTISVDAIYVNGVLRPLAPIEGLSDNVRVRLLIEEQKTTQSLLRHCGTVPDADTREIADIIEREFEQVDPNDWK